MAVFCAGSIARGEVGSQSDVDLFVLSQREEEEIGVDECFEVMASALDMESVDQLGSPRFRNIYPISKLVERTGTPKDDNENLFTTRMLLLLEGRSVFNTEIISHAREHVLEHYFRDARGRGDFRPLFLLNDILRYWRTLCLNYELKRNDATQPWRKKNINLKFARMMTVFGTILPIISEPLEDQTSLEEVCRLSPIERLERGLANLEDADLNTELASILALYEEFLSWKEQENIEEQLDNPELKRELREKAEQFVNFFHHALTHEQIDFRYRRLLVI